MKKIIVSIFFVFAFSFANLIDVYRTQGLNAVKIKFDEQLMSKKYWDKYLSHKNVKYGYYESKKYLLLAEKQKKEIQLLKIEKDDFTLLLTSNIIVGEIKGDKQTKGDLKTPEGTYNIIEKLTKLDQFYGPFALVTSYPNMYDKILNKNGDGIWIHGMPLNAKRESFTKGCIALDNDKLEIIDESIVYDKSILLISNEDFKMTTKEDISTILTTIYKWQNAWETSNIHEYLNFYSDSFKRYDGMSFENFIKYKKRIFNKKEEKRIIFKNINIAPYPNSLDKKMFKIIMDEDYKTKNYTFVGKKELYIELKNNEVKILAED